MNPTGWYSHTSVRDRYWVDEDGFVFPLNGDGTINSLPGAHKVDVYVQHGSLIRDEVIIQEDPF